LLFCVFAQKSTFRSGLALNSHGFVRGATAAGAAVGGVAAGAGRRGVGAARIACTAVMKDDPRLFPIGDKPVISATAKMDAIMP
jgi:hypothetical protein